MFTYDLNLSPTDNLLRVLTIMGTDGQLTVEEVWAFADWLNHNRAAAEVWPGTEFVPILQRIWSDDILESNEVDELSQAISRVETIVASIRSGGNEEKKSATRKKIQPVSCSPLADLTLPLVDRTFFVRSSNGNDEYTVNLAGPHCTCPDFTTRRRGRPLGSIGRACKHVVQTVFEIGLYRELPQPTWAVLSGCQERGGGTSPDDRYVTIGVDGKQFIASASSEWVNVVEVRDAKTVRFGYNLPQKRWAYGESPTGARSLRTIFHQLWPAAGG
jgi:hypothetical protein